MINHQYQVLQQPSESLNNQQRNVAMEEGQEICRLFVLLPTNSQYNTNFQADDSNWN